MTSSTSSSRPSVWREIADKPPRAALVALLVIALVELTASFFPPRTTDTPLLDNRFYPADRVPTFDDSIVQWQVFHVVNGVENQDILLTGDSSALMGLRPLDMMVGNKLKVWNFGTLAWYGTEGHKLLVELFVHYRGTPKLVVYHVAWVPLTSGFFVDAYGSFTRLSKWIKSTVEADQDEFTPLPTMAYRHLVRSLAVSERTRWSLANQNRGIYGSDEEVRRDLLAARGALTEPKHERFPTADVRLDFAEGRKRALAEMFALSDEYGFDMILMLEPLPASADTPGTARSAAELEHAVRQIAAPYRRVRIFDPFVRFYPNELVATETHLTPEGAVKNTADLMRWFASISRKPTGL